MIAALMPDLGSYATFVLSAYAVSIVLILALVGLSVWAAKRAQAALDEAEARRRNG